MLTIFVGEQRNGRIKLTSDRDCLAPDIIRFSERVFVDLDHVKASASALEDRGFHVCVDTADYFYETN
jgi:hypothetical protein